MLKEAIRTLLATLEQEELGVGLDQLSAAQLQSFLLQLKKYDVALLHKQRKLLSQQQTQIKDLSPYENYQRTGSQERLVKGESLVDEGKVGCLILAGGQGSRLGTTLPKALLPVTPIKEKTLLQYFLEKTLAASERTKRPLPVALMTSPLNHPAITDYLKKCDWFGLSPAQVSLFAQSMLPLLDERGNWFLSEPGRLAEAPDGNGEALHHFFHAGIWQKWKAQGVECVHVILIDNPLADPFDAELAAYHWEKQASVTLKAIERLDPEEKVGVIGKQKQKLHVAEYSELAISERTARKSDGTLTLPLANTSLFCFSMDFIKNIAQNLSLSLPWHLAQKKHIVWSEKASQEQKLIWKCETFIFDLLPYAESSQVLLYPRAETFAPLKNQNGPGSLTSVHAALVARDRSIYSDLSGLPAPNHPFELAPAFYYPTPNLKNKWKGRPLSQQEYIEP